MQIDLNSMDWERIAIYLQRLAVRERFRKKNECQNARRLGNIIAKIVAEQRSEWMNERQKWDKERLKELVFKQGKTPEEIAKILGTSPEKVEKVLRRLNLLQKKRNFK